MAPRCRFRPLAAGLLALGGVLAPAATPLAQEAAGGVTLSFSLSQRLARTSNPDLTVPAGPGEWRSDTRFQFGFLSETRRDRLALATGADLRSERTPGGDDRFHLRDPFFTLDYQRSGATSSFALSAFRRESALDEQLVLGLDADDNLALFYEQGTVRRQGGRVSYSWGDEMPFGGSLGLGRTDTSYAGTSDPSLVDNRTLTANLGLHLALDAATTATLDLGWRRFERDSATLADQVNTSLAFGLGRELVRGRVWARLAAKHDQNGTRHELSFGRALALPDGSLSMELGLSRSPAGKTGAVGSLAWQRELPTGLLQARLSRGFSYDSANSLSQVTSASLGLQQALGERVGFSLTALWTRSEETATDIVTDTGYLDAALGYQLTEDWGLNLGLTHRLRDKTGVGRANSGSVYLSLARNFEWHH